MIGARHKREVETHHCHTQKTLPELIPSGFLLSTCRSNPLTDKCLRHFGRVSAVSLTTVVIVGLSVVMALIVLAVTATFAWWQRPRPMTFVRKPDTPKPFGNRTAWLAIKTRDTQRVLEALGIEDQHKANWASGISGVYDDKFADQYVFVTPPVSGWTFVVGLALPQPLGSKFSDLATPLLNVLGQQFNEVQYYFTYPEIDFYAWAKIVDGKLIRAFAWGDEGVIWNKGRLSKEERSLGLKVLELRAVNGGNAAMTEYAGVTTFPNEEQVLSLAGKWSIDPTRLEASTMSPATGVFGRVPMTWKVKRTERSSLAGLSVVKQGERQALRPVH